MLFAGPISLAQTQDTLSRSLHVSIDIRPRAEFRDKYLQNPLDSVLPDFFISQRNRIELAFQLKGFKIQASPQEIHVWGKSGKASAVGSVNFYELYLEQQISKKLSVKAGRQGVSVDNGRLFSTAPWAQQSRSHEGVRLFYEGKFKTDFMAAFTRSYSDKFSADYSPVASHRYKLLLMHHFESKFHKNLNLMTLNVAESFETTTSQQYTRATSGGRLEFENDNLYLTLAGYYQYGKDENLRSIKAYYLQPEIRIAQNKLTFRLGAEILSGQEAPIQGAINRSFVPLYGVVFRFMGNMNFFTRFPRDVDNRGLLNPNLFCAYEFNKKTSLTVGSHLFYSQYGQKSATNGNTPKYLGFENDITLRYLHSKNVELVFGFCYYLPEPSMVLLKKVQDSNSTPVWTYLMVSYHPVVYQKGKAN